MTPRALFQDVLEDIGYLGVGDYFSNDDAQKCLRRANAWLDFLATQNLTAYYLQRVLKNLASGTDFYSVGAGGDINIVRPVAIDSAGLMLTRGSQLAAPASLTATPVGTTGATTYNYSVTAIDAGGETTARAASPITTGNATLSASNYNHLAWASVDGATGYRIYRVTGSVLLAEVDAATLTYNDVGAAGTAGTAPTTNTTAGDDTVGTPGVEIPVGVFTPQQWENTTIKKLSSPLVRWVYYDFNWNAGLAGLHVWPVPNVGTTQLVLYAKQALTKFEDLDDDLTFPPGYEYYYRTNLVLELASPFGQVATAEQQRQAGLAALAIKRTNSRPVESRLDPRLPGRVAGNLFDYRTGELR